MNPDIFREYDIRGIAGEDLTDENVLTLGRALGTYFHRNNCKQIMVGQDCRTSSPAYAKQVIAGLRASGCNVIDIGICPTPILYFSIQHFKADGGVMVTASHNPPQYNGFKLCQGLDSLHGEQIQQIYQLIQNQDFVDGQGTLDAQDAVTPYKSFVLDNINLSRPLKIAIDAGNGTAGVIAQPVLEALGCEVHALYCDMDGRFPNHEADPTKVENLKALIALVQSKGLDVGLGYDGDGDRIGVIDETGNMVYGDQLMIIFAREILTRKPGATFISEVKCSQTMYDDIEKHGGRAIMWKTGHSLIKKKMKAEQAELAGEMSGHIFFADRYLGFDDATYASCRLLEILADSGKRVSELLADVPQTFTTPEIRVDCPDDQKFAVVDQVTRHFKKEHRVIDIDGMRVLFDDGWGLVRASNTQPALVLRFEALTEARLTDIRQRVETVLHRIQHPE